MTRSRLVQRKEEVKKPIKRNKKIPMKRERGKLMKRRNRSSESATRTRHKFVLAATCMCDIPSPRWCFFIVVRDLTTRVKRHA